MLAREGVNASIAVTDERNGSRIFHVSGKVVVSSTMADMRQQLMLGHLAALLHGAPRSVLVVGCGAGVTAGPFVRHPSVERIAICEIEASLPPAAATYVGNKSDLSEWLQAAEINRDRNLRIEILRTNLLARFSRGLDAASGGTPR